MQPDGMLIEQYLRSVRPIAQSFSRSIGVELEDLLQDVALRFTVKWPLIAAANNPPVYAKVVARNLMINQYRKAKRLRGQAWIASLDRPLRADSDLTLLDVLEG